MAINEGRVYFALDGDDFDPDEVSRLLEIEPTDIKRKGSKIPGKVPIKSSWELSTENILDEFVDVFEMAESIVEKLRPKKSQIIEAIDQFNLKPRLEVVLWFSVDEEHSNPAIGFESETVRFLGEIGALIDIDTYKH